MKCRICNRPLRNPKWVALGIGPVCARKGGLSEPAHKCQEGHQYYLDDVSVEEKLVFKRINNNAFTNVRQAVIHHSPTGFEWGYGGSGPADLALNIMNHFLPLKPGEQGVNCFKGIVSWAAYDLHQEFKWKFVTRLPREDGAVKEIPSKEIEDWILQEMAKRAETKPERYAGR